LRKNGLATSFFAKEFTEFWKMNVLYLWWSRIYL